MEYVCVDASSLKLKPRELAVTICVQYLGPIAEFDIMINKFWGDNIKKDDKRRVRTIFESMTYEVYSEPYIRLNVDNVIKILSSGEPRKYNLLSLYVFIESKMIRGMHVAYITYDMFTSEHKIGSNQIKLYLIKLESLNVIRRMRFISQNTGHVYCYYASLEYERCLKNVRNPSNKAFIT
jgi:hypothetical protein